MCAGRSREGVDVPCLQPGCPALARTHTRAHTHTRTRTHNRLRSGNPKRPIPARSEDETTTSSLHCNFHCLVCVCSTKSRNTPRFDPSTTNTSPFQLEMRRRMSDADLSKRLGATERALFFRGICFTSAQRKPRDHGKLNFPKISKISTRGGCEGYPLV